MRFSLIIFLILAAACSKSAGLTRDKAQRAVDLQIENLKKQYAKGARKTCGQFIVGDGRATVVGVLENPSNNTATADVTFTDLTFGGYGLQFDESVTLSNGSVGFIRYNDGRWVMNRFSIGRNFPCNGNEATNIEVQ